MSEVKRYGHIGYLVNASERLIELYRDMTVYVKADDFDRVTAERDALQQRLTAADERADVLEGWLRRWSAEAGGVFCALKYETDAALKPAEGGGDEA